MTVTPKNPLRFRNDSNNLLSSALFMETGAAPEYAYYTVQREDHPSGFVSLYKLYMAEADLTEFTFASKHFESYQHWKRICALSWFKPIIAQWREELELKIRAEALQRLIDEGKAGGRSASTINRFLVEGGWKDKNTKGRPSKDDIKREATRLADEAISVSEDAARVLPFIQQVN